MRPAGPAQPGRIGWLLLRSALILLAAWLVVVGTEWWPRPTGQERADLALLQIDAPVSQGDDGFADLWTLGYAVPAGERASVLAEDVAIHNATPHWQDTPDPLTVASVRYPSRADDYRSSVCCGADGPRLDLIEARRWSLAPYLLGHAGLVHALIALERHPQFRNPLPMRFWSAFPSLQLLRFRLLQLALLHAERPSEAMAGVCAHLGMLRRLRGSASDVLHEQFATETAMDSLRLLADMQARQPLPLPLSCAADVQPLSDAELDTCGVMRGEFAAWTATLDETTAHPVQSEKVTPVMDAIGPLLIHRAHSRARVAATYARFCRSGRDVRDPRLGLGPVRSCHAWKRILNPVGCMLAVDLSAAYNRYQRQRLDLDRALRLFQAAQWLRARPAPLRPDLAGLPDAGRLPPGEMQLDLQAGVLRMPRLDTRRAATWEIPLAGSQRN